MARRRMIRIAIILLIFGTLVAKLVSHQARLANPIFHIGAQIEAVLAASPGAVVISRPEKSTEAFAALVYFRLPNCEEEFLVMPTGFIPEAGGMMTFKLRNSTTMYHNRLIYFDRSFAPDSHWPLYGQWLKHYLQAQFGQSPYIPVKQALYLTEPAGCTTDGRIDWSKVWRR
jgi:hypothetical protein